MTDAVDGVREHYRANGLVERLKTATPILSQLVAEKKLTMAGGLYELATGKVTLL